MNTIIIVKTLMLSGKTLDKVIVSSPDGKLLDSFIVHTPENLESMVQAAKTFKR